MLVEHHVKYREIHGIDETVWLIQSEHVKLHRNLRIERKCNIPANVLKKISQAAYKRTDKAKTSQAANKLTDKAKDTQKKYRKENIFEKMFTERIGINIDHRTVIYYNNATKHMGIYCGFQGDHKKLLYIDLN